MFVVLPTICPYQTPVDDVVTTPYSTTVPSGIVYTGALVPEPTTSVLFGLGLFTLVFYGRPRSLN